MWNIDKYAIGGMLPTQEDLKFQGANIDFAGYVPPNLNVIGQSAAFMQKKADERYDELLKERQTIIDAIKLDKRFSELQGQLTGQLDSIVQNAAKTQLSDNANYTKFNTALIKVKHDPTILNALKSTEYAKAYADWRQKNPDKIDIPYLSGGNEERFKRFQNGQTDEFIMTPTYTEPKWQEEIFKFVKDIPDEEKEVFKTYGSAIYQEKVKGKDADSIRERSQNKIKELLTNPETAAHFKRMSQYGYDPLAAIQQTLNSAIDQYKSQSVTMSNLQRNPSDVSSTEWARINQAERKLNAEEGGPQGFIDYATGDIFSPGSKKKENKANEQNLMANLLIKSGSPLLLTDINTGTVAREGKQMKTYNMSNYTPTGSFYPKGNEVFVEVQGDDNKKYYVRYNKNDFETQTVGTSTKTPVAKPLSKKTKF